MQERGGEYQIFYSWQSVLPHKSNRTFIREAIEEATAAISQDGVVEDAPRIDEGMDGVAGTPEVATIMFQKIDTSAIFIGDVSFVGSTEPFDGNREKKRVPNPNVLLEMGYAAARIGWSRIICVLNEHFGEREEQPFDVRNRRFPINYRLETGRDPNRDAVKTQLAGDIRGAIEVMTLSEHQRVATIRSKLDSRCLNLMNQFASQPNFSITESGDYWTSSRQHARRRCNNAITGHGRYQGRCKSPTRALCLPLDLPRQSCTSRPGDAEIAGNGF